MVGCVCVCVGMLGYLNVFIIHRNLTCTTGSLTCVGDLFVYVYTREALSEGRFVETGQN